MPPQFGSGLLAEAGRELGSTVVVKGHKSAVECGIPQRRQQQAIVHVEPLGIVRALGPRDVRGDNYGGRLSGNYDGR